MENVLTDYELQKKFDYRSSEESLREKISRICKRQNVSLSKLISGFFPIFVWLPNYSIKNSLPGDLIGGLTTAIVRIPQGLAYGLLAGLDPINGIYTSFFAPLVYGFLGTSRHVSVGTFAVISLMLGSALEKVLSDSPNVLPCANDNVAITMPTLSTEPDVTSAVNVNNVIEDEHALFKLSIIGSLTLLIGLIQIALGLLNLGFISLLLSDPLISGFTTGAAVYVVAAQIKYMFGISLNRHSAPFSLFKLLYELFSRISETNPAEIVVSVITMVTLYPIKLINIKYKKQLRNIPIPMELIIVVVATVVSTYVDLKGIYGIAIVGHIPSGLPTPYWPIFDITIWSRVLSDAFSIAIVSFAITVSIGKLFAKKHHYKIEPNQELFAVGTSQLFCGFFQGHACSGALARSSVKESSGAKTQLSDFISSAVILLVLLLLGPFLKNLPVACLSSIIVVNIRTLFLQFTKLPRLWRLCKYDFSVWILTFIATVLFGVDFGLIIGIVCLLGTVVLQKYLASASTLGRIGKTSLYRSVDQYTKAERISGIQIIKFPDAPFFGNVQQLETIRKEIVYAKRKFMEPKNAIRECELPLSPVENSNDVATVVTIDVTEKSSAASSSAKNRVRARFSKDEGKVKESHDTDKPLYSDASVVTNPGTALHTVIFDCSSWLYIDTMGLEAVQQMCKEFKENEIPLYFAELQPHIFELFDRECVFDEESRIFSFPSVDIAVKACDFSSICQPTDSAIAEC